MVPTLPAPPCRPRPGAENTIERGHNNSMLVLGDRGSGKSLVRAGGQLLACWPGPEQAQTGRPLWGSRSGRAARAAALAVLRHLQCAS